MRLVDKEGNLSTAKFSLRRVEIDDEWNQAMTAISDSV